MTIARTYILAFCLWLEQRDHHPQLRWSWQRCMEFSRNVEPLNRHSCIAYMVHCLYAEHYRVLPPEEGDER